jgi:hypothetical protein
MKSSLETSVVSGDLVIAGDAIGVGLITRITADGFFTILGRGQRFSTVKATAVSRTQGSTRFECSFASLVFSVVSLRSFLV